MPFVLWLEDTVPIGVQGRRPAVTPQPAAQQVQVRLGRGRRIEACQDAVGGVVDHADEDHLLAAAFQPVVDRGVHVHQFAEARPARTAAAMRLAAALTLPHPFGDEPAAERLGADAQPFGGQLLAGEGRSKVGVALPVGGDNGLAEVGVRLMVGRPAAQSVNEGLISVGLESSLNASDLADAFVEESSRLRLAAFAAQNGVHKLENIAFLLAHGYPVEGKHADRQGSSLT